MAFVRQLRMRLNLERRGSDWRAGTTHSGGALHSALLARTGVAAAHHFRQALKDRRDAPKTVLRYSKLHVDGPAPTLKGAAASNAIHTKDTTLEWVVPG